MTILTVSGCTATNFDATEIAKTNQAVKAFLSDYPNANVIATYVANTSISGECNNPQLQQKNYWRINIFDEASNLTINTWVDSDTRNVVCIVKTGGIVSQEQPNNQTNNTGSQECYEKYDCGFDEYCSGGSCKKLVCQNGSAVQNHECIQMGGQGASPSREPEVPVTGRVDTDDDPRIGDAVAPVIIIEFGDFQCPFCSRFFEQTFTQIDNEYIKTGKVLFVYRDFPLSSIHPLAQKAAEAAECADEEGKFWEIHNWLFSDQASWAYSDISIAIEKFKAEAQAISLTGFDSCLDSGKYASEVAKDYTDGLAADVSGTPTFFIGSPERGYVQVTGAQPFSVFKQAIENQE